MNLVEYFTPAAIAASWTSAADALPASLGATLFPSKKKAGLDLAWLKGYKGVPVSLMPSAFDTKATFRDRIGFEKLETEMPFFREGFKISEKDRQELLRAEDSKDPYATEIINRVFDDAAELISGAEVVAERMRMQLLFPENGNVGIAIKANGVDYSYNYDTNGSWKTNNFTALTGDDLWTAVNTADPFKAIKTVRDSIRTRTGTTVTTMVMNTNTFNLLGSIAAIKNRFLTSNGLAVAYLTDEEIKAVIKGTTGLDIAVYDNLYRDENKVTHAYVPDGYVSFIPAGTIGSTWYGTTPEEADLRGSDAQVSIVNTGVAISREIIQHPVNINTYASEIVLPSYERMDEVACLKVIA